MRSTWLATAGVALVCAPCILVLLVGAGIGTSALSAIGSALSEPGLAIAAGFIAILLFGAAAAVLMRRRADAACETGITATAGDAGFRGSHRVAPEGKPRR